MHPSWSACFPLTLLAFAGIVPQTSPPSTSAAGAGTVVITGVSIVDTVRGTTRPRRTSSSRAAGFRRLRRQEPRHRGVARRASTARGVSPSQAWSMFMRILAKAESRRRTTPRVPVRSVSSFATV